MSEALVTVELEALLAEFTRSGARELHIRAGDAEIYLSSDPSIAGPVVQPRGEPERNPSPAMPVQAAPAATAPAGPSTITPGAVVVRAPNLGTFYGAPKPGAAPYVSVGSSVSAGAELCLIEVMKLFTAVRAEVDGRIDAIFASDGEMIEAGQPLFAIVTA